MKWVCIIALLPLVAAADSYSEKVLADKPVAYWRFGEAVDLPVKSSVGKLNATLSAQHPSGPRPIFYPDFSEDNRALQLAADGAFVRVIDPGKESALDFTKGDSITLEAWVSPDAMASGRMM